MTQPGLAELFLRFCLFSLMAVGGANAVLPEIHHQVVETGRWMSSADFAALYAIAQAAPGPNVLIVSLIGWKVAGVAGAIVSIVGMCLPSSLLAFQAGKLWYRFGNSPWRKLLERALAPITVGLVFGSGCVITGLNGHEWSLYLITIVCAVAAFFSRANPLWWLAIAAALGLSGMV